MIADTRANKSFTSPLVCRKTHDSFALFRRLPHSLFLHFCTTIAIQGSLNVSVAPIVGNSVVILFRMYVPYSTSWTTFVNFHFIQYWYLLHSKDTTTWYIHTVWPCYQRKDPAIHSHKVIQFILTRSVVYMLWKKDLTQIVYNTFPK